MVDAVFIFRFDKASTEGSFKLHVYDEDKFVPVLLRDDKKCVSIRMAEISVLGEFLNLLPPELYDHIKISSYFVSINSLHEFMVLMFFL